MIFTAPATSGAICSNEFAAMEAPPVQIPAVNIIPIRSPVSMPRARFLAAPWPMNMEHPM